MTTRDYFFIRQCEIPFHRLKDLRKYALHMGYELMQGSEVYATQNVSEEEKRFIGFIRWTEKKVTISKR